MLALAQMDLSSVAQGLATNPLAWGLAIALVTIGYQHRQNVALFEKLIDEARAGAERERKLLEQIVPLATKLTDSLELVADRLKE